MRRISVLVHIQHTTLTERRVFPYIVFKNLLKVLEHLLLLEKCVARVESTLVDLP